MTGTINKSLLLHLVGSIYYLYQLCTVKQISDNEIYLLFKYIKSVLWRVAKRLSYIEDARCLKVKTITQRSRQQRTVSWLYMRILRTLLRKEDSKWKENRIQTSKIERTCRKDAGFFADDFNSDVEENEVLEDENFPCGFCGVKWASTCDWIKCQICGKMVPRIMCRRKKPQAFICG